MPIPRNSDEAADWGDDDADYIDLAEALNRLDLTEAFPDNPQPYQEDYDPE